MAVRLFTSESVTEDHLDQIADQISDTVLGALLREDPTSRVAVETPIATGLVRTAGEGPAAARETGPGPGSDRTPSNFKQEATA